MVLKKLFVGGGAGGELSKRMNGLFKIMRASG